MIEKKLIIADIDKLILETNDQPTIAALEILLQNILNEKYNVRIWD